MDTPLLDQLCSPSDIHKIDKSYLVALARELRYEVISCVSENGGFLGSNLAVIELTLALHHVFDSETDHIIWDIGHQCYAHKILSARRRQMHQLGQQHGASMFTNPDESISDHNTGNGHPGHGISQSLGFASAARIRGISSQTVCVFGDRSVSSGQLFEALNFIGQSPDKVILIFNDNTSTAPNTALGELLRAHHTETPQMFFESMGIRYFSCVDGHDINALAENLTTIKQDPENSPIVLHVRTQKGRGYSPAEKAVDGYDTVNQFRLRTGIQSQSDKTPSWVQLFYNHLAEKCKMDSNLCLVTTDYPQAAHDHFLNHQHESLTTILQDRYFNFEAAHCLAVSFTAAMAQNGFMPNLVIGASFIPKVGNQILFDLCRLKDKKINIIIDQANMSGRLSPEHQGNFDFAQIQSFPNISVYTPADQSDFLNVLQMDFVGVRFIRLSNLIGYSLPEYDVSPIRKDGGREIHSGEKYAFISFGGRVNDAYKASEMLRAYDLDVGVYDLRFLKPLDQDLLNRVAHRYDEVFFISDLPLSAYDLQPFVQNTQVKMHHICAENNFIPHDRFVKQMQNQGLTATKIRDVVLTKLNLQERAVA